jgi:tripartite-type tricarboxylate transporter receptor subunit TctC
MAAANPDGYTILLGSVGPLAVAPHLVAKLPYDPLKDLAPLTMAVNFPNVLVVHAGVPAKTLAEYIALAKAKPGSLDYASTGVGSASHLAGELFNQRAGVDIVHIPYKGGGPAMTDLLGGRVSTYYSTHSTAGPHIESGKLRAIAVTGAKRSSFLPNVPTIAESGFPGFEASNWYAFVTSAKVPLAIQERWNKELVKALSAPDVKAQLAQHFMEPSPGTREELAAYIKQEYENWGRVVKKANIQAN